MEFVKPNVVISACFNHAKCRYDGELISEDFLKLLEPYVNYIRVCPEVSIGLGIPRNSLRLVKEVDEIILKENETNRDLTDKMVNFSTKYLKELNDIQGFILKAKSPSCGIKDVKIYHSMGKSSAVGKGSGLFAQIVLDLYETYPIIDDGRLKDFHIREHFLSRLFLLSEFDEMKKSPSLKALQAFHHKHKMLLLSFNQVGLKRLGNIIASSKKEMIHQTLIDYRIMLLKSTSRLPSIKSKVNVFLHTFGQISEKLKKSDKKFVLESLEQFRNSQIPFSSLLILLKAYAINVGDNKILNQSFFHPFPLELIQLRDSGKQII